jgi:hypothetical protein
MRKEEACIERLSWIVGRTLLARDPGPNDPDVRPVREPEPEPDTPEPEPGDEPERTDPLWTSQLHNFRATGA